MHELAITESILEIATRHARRANAGRITDLYLVIGELSSIIDDSVQFYWDFVSEGTVAEGAQLHFKRVPAEMACRMCRHRYDPGEDLACPECGSTDVRVSAGVEFYLESIGVAQDIENSVPM